MPSIYNTKLLDKIKGETVEPKEIHKRRRDAFEKFKKIPMPSPKLESWRYTNIMELNLNEFLPISQEIEFSGLDKDLKEKGVIFTDIKTALEEHFDIIKEHMPVSLIKHDEDKFTAMHAALWNDGVFIYVPKNVVLKIPLRNKFSVTGNGGIYNHTLIIMEENSSLDYVEEHISKKGDFLALRNDMVEIYAKDNSFINFHSLQNWKRNVINISNWSAKLQRDSKLNWYFGQFGGKISRVKVDTYFKGEGSESNNKGVFYADKDQHFDITTDAHHLVPHTTGNILVKGVLDDKSTAVYRGKIKITEKAQDTNSYLSDHSLILSEDALSNSIPSLEIDANEVSASHGATLGRPDDEEIFYLTSRGLPEKVAEKLIILGFFAQVTEDIEIDDLREKFETYLEEKYFD